MERAKVLTLAELVQGERPLTAADSLHSRRRSRSATSSSSSYKSPRSDQTSKPRASRVTNPNPKVLTPLYFPAILVGTVHLPAVVSPEGNSASSSASRCPYDSCLQFSDGSATICCDVLDLELGIIGKEIQVLAWNFVPMKRGCGFLEIIRWSFSDSEMDRRVSSGTDSFSLTPSSSCGREANSKSGHSLHGSLELISPISVNPCSSGSDSLPASNLRGFLVRIRVCECRSCSSREQSVHSFTKAVFVYFCGSASSWHPVITKLVGSVVSLIGLKKKLVCLGKEKSFLLYVTAENSHLRRLRSLEKLASGGEREEERLSYMGIVKGVYFQGMVVELDNEVWLLLTNRLFNLPHSLRVGALISVRNVHFVNPKFSWTKMLILGACYKTSISVECFSPLLAGSHILTDSRSMLGNFIESLAFCARLWVLLLVSCFRKKFSGALSDKEILGTKTKEGLVQIYANSQLPLHSLRSSANRHGVFMSLCSEGSCCCEGHGGNLKLVVPIITFIHLCDAKWMRSVELQNDVILCEGRSYDQSVRKVFSSEDMGVVLIGSLKISPFSGRLQLVDGTGEIDVVIPDLPTSWNSKSIYEVVDYSLVIEGIPKLVDHLGLTDKSFSCRSIFNFSPLARLLNLRVCIQFHLRNAACKNISLYPSAESEEDPERLKSGTYHLLQLTHKFPVLEKFQGDTATSNAQSIFAEAVIFRWNLLLSGKDGFARETKNFGDHLQNDMENCDVGVHLENNSKRRKTEIGSRVSSGLVDIPSTTFRQLRTCSNLDNESSEEQINEISCSATIRGAGNHRVLRSAILRYTGASLNGPGIGRLTGQKALLEFESESFYTYQIGCFYITEHGRHACFCKYKDSDHASGVKIRVSSKLHLWSLSFTHEVLPGSNLSNCPLEENSCSYSDNVFSNDRNEVRLHISKSEYLETSSDISLSLPANRIGIFKENMTELKESMIKSEMPCKGVTKVSLCTISMLSSTNNSFLLPEGNLISLRGHVVAVHNIDAHLNCQNLGDSLRSRFLSGSSSSCLHVLVGHRIVKIHGSMSQHFFPPGFSPGVDVTIHRVLELRAQDRWMLTPVSFIVINSITPVKPSSKGSSSPHSEVNDVSALESFSLGLISELVQQPDCKLTRIRGRVVAVNVLVFETCRNVDPRQKFRSRQKQVDIPIAGFVLDDGSSSCCCWANAERAATFLRLHEELPKRAFESNDRRLNRTVKAGNSTCQTIRYRLGRILQKHKKITVKNFGSLLDSSFQDLAVSVSSDKALNCSDESFLKNVVLNACVGASWTVVGSLMDSDTIGHLEKQQKLLEINKNSMQNIWAKEVHYTNPLTEARTIIQELLVR